MYLIPKLEYEDLLQGRRNTIDNGANQEYASLPPGPQESNSSASSSSNVSVNAPPPPPQPPAQVYFSPYEQQQQIAVDRPTSSIDALAPDMSQQQFSQYARETAVNDPMPRVQREAPAIQQMVHERLSDLRREPIAIQPLPEPLPLSQDDVEMVEYERARQKRIPFQTRPSITNKRAKLSLGMTKDYPIVPRYDYDVAMNEYPRSVKRGSEEELLALPNKRAKLALSRGIPYPVMQRPNNYEMEVYGRQVPSQPMLEHTVYPALTQAKKPSIPSRSILKRPAYEVTPSQPFPKRVQFSETSLPALTYDAKQALQRDLRAPIARDVRPAITYERRFDPRTSAPFGFPTPVSPKYARLDHQAKKRGYSYDENDDDSMIPRKATRLNTY